MLVFADLFGAADPKVPYWGPPSFPWHDAFGSTDLYHAQNIGQLYAGALAIVAVIGFGIVRGLLWSREIRFFTATLVLTLLYALGKYTPAFRAMYEVLPGVSLYRRPADATFLFGLMLAICAGYLVHRWLMASVPPPARWQRVRRDRHRCCACVAGSASLAITVGTWREAILPILIGIVVVACAVGALRLAYRLAATNALAAAAVLAAFSTADLAWNNAPNESTGLPPSFYDALRPDTTNETVALLKSKLAAAAAPDRRDRVELIGIGYHWPNLGAGPRLRPSVRAQSAAARRFRARDRRGRHRGGARPARRSRRCFPPTAPPSKTCSACASSRPACRSNRSTSAQARRSAR